MAGRLQDVARAPPPSAHLRRDLRRNRLEVGHSETSAGAIIAVIGRSETIKTRNTGTLLANVRRGTYGQRRGAEGTVERYFTKSMQYI